MRKSDLYTACLREIDIRLEKGGDLIADLGNVAAILKKRFQYYWIGFYFYRENRMVLGPFQGTPACVFLPFGKGVCGECAKTEKSIIVPDVHAFPGHIACDQESKSEIVIPLFDETGALRGVLDIDHDRLDAFDETDQQYLEKIAERIRPMWSEK